MMRLLMRKGAIALFGAAMLAAAPSAFAADTVSVGSVDATSANLWPLQIARTNGYFDAAGINIDQVRPPLCERTTGRHFNDRCHS